MRISGPIVVKKSKEKSMIRTAISFAALLLICLSGCKREKLRAEYAVAEGLWYSTSTVMNCGIAPGMPQDPGLRLELNGRGTYAVSQLGKKVESGRLTEVDGSLTFSSRCENARLNGLKVLHYTSDSLNIGRNGCDDDYLFRFVRNW
jgi:hypothetical protein